MSIVEFDEEHFTRPPPVVALDVPVEMLAQVIARRHGLTIEQIKGPSREKHIFKARKMLYHALRDRGWSYPAIGRFVGGRDHTTIMKGLHQ